jgi:hypothetical protein
MLVPENDIEELLIKFISLSTVDGSFVMDLKVHHLFLSLYE